MSFEPDFIGEVKQGLGEPMKNYWNYEPTPYYIKVGKFKRCQGNGIS